MAQHYKLDEAREPKVFRSIRRITKYVNKNYNWKHYKADDREIVYGKEFARLPDEYYSDGRAFTLGHYNLKKADWGENNTGVTLEIHCDKWGNLLNVYYPL